MLLAGLYNHLQSGMVTGCAPSPDAAAAWPLHAGGAAAGLHDLMQPQPVLCNQAEPQAEFYNWAGLSLCSAFGQGRWPDFLVGWGLILYPTVGGCH